MNKKSIIGFFFIGFSILVAFSNFTITGAVIGALISNFVSVITIGLFIGGVFLLLESSGLEKITTADGKKTVIMSDDAIKKFRLYRREMLSAINKIGTGTGREKKMKHYDFYTIREGEKARLLFTNDISEVNVIDYLTDHDYDRWMRSHEEHHKTQSKPRKYAYAH